jgi:hypothetical protein
MDIKEYYKKYYVEHKETILNRGKALLQCSCGKQIGRSHYARHIRTKLHKKRETNQSDASGDDVVE